MSLLRGGYLGNLIGGSGYDADTQAFINAASLEIQVTAGVVTRAQVNALDNFVVGLKTAGLWTLIDCLYPFIGGTAFCHKFNLRDPALYQIAWAGALNHTVAGVFGVNGGNGIGETGYIQTINQAYIGLYVTTSLGPQIGHDWGAFSNGSVASDLHYQWPDGRTYGDLGSQLGTGRLSVVTGKNLGFKSVSKVGQSQYIYSDNSVSATSVSTDTGVTNITYKLFRGLDQPCPGRTYSLAIAGKGLTPAQHSTLYNLNQSYQLALGRAV
jgi:hypothetical protein